MRWGSASTFGPGCPQACGLTIVTGRCITHDAAMMRHMRTTVDLPPGVHRRAQALAKAQGRSLSATIADLTVRGLAQIDERVEIQIDERSGFPVMSFGGPPITPEQVAAILDDE